MKYLKGGGPLPPKEHSLQIIKGFIGGSISILLLGYFTQISGSEWLMAPFGASCVILYAASKAPFAQPRNVIGGHVLSGLVGLVMLYLFGNNLISIALGVGIALSLMQYFRVTHPPAGANPLVIMLTGQQSLVNWDYLLNPILSGSVLLVIIAFIVNNMGKQSHWPVYWHGVTFNKKDK
ncbi:CBS-domain-containing membrane protein [Providencia alcalifaciens]|nr:CBS-domain-containing membrane protein [Providencia alcalifaciens]